MSEEFKPGTRPLLRLAGLDGERPFVSREDENDALWTAVLALMMRFHLVPDPEARRKAGASDAQVVAGLRAALAENFGLEAAGYLAWALVHYGCRQKPTLASLPPWEELMFEWQERRATAPRIALMLRASGLPATLPAASLEALDGWIGEPPKALGEGSSIVATLFGERLVSWPLRGDDTPAHDGLLHALLGSVDPAVPIESLHQHRRTADGSRWTVEYSQGGRDWAFDVASPDGRVDVDAVMDGADALIERAGRPERVFRLQPGRLADADRGWFIVADGARFGELVLRLRLPVLRTPRVPEAGEILPGTARPDPAAVRPPRANGSAAAAPGDAGEAIQPAPVEADPAMRSLIGSLRRTFGTGRLLQAGRWAKQSRAEAPGWTTQGGGDPVAVFYERQETLIRKGRVAWGALVLAHPGLLNPGEGDLPLVIVTSEDEHFDARPAELAAWGARLAGLQTGRAAPPPWRDLARQVRNDAGRPMGVAVPAHLSPRPLVLTSTVGIRAHLPAGVLSSAWFPLLTHESSAAPMIVPSALWPAALRAAWDEGRLGRTV